MPGLCFTLLGFSLRQNVVLPLARDISSFLGNSIGRVGDAAVGSGGSDHEGCDGDVAAIGESESESDCECCGGDAAAIG